MRKNAEIRRIFLQKTKEAGLATGTIYRYRRWIRKLIEFHHGVALEELDDQDILEFFESLSKYSVSVV